MADTANELGALQRSMAEFPNIEPGDDFTGYA